MTKNNFEAELAIIMRRSKENSERIDKMYAENGSFVIQENGFQRFSLGGKLSEGPEPTQDELLWREQHKAKRKNTQASHF